MWVESSNGVDVDRVVKTLPSTVWVAASENEGTYHDVSPKNAAEFGLYPVDVVERPGDDYRRTITNNGPGLFEMTWVFDQATADANAAAAADEAERQAARNKIADLDAFIADPDVTSAEAVAELKEHARILKRLIRDMFGE